MRQALPDLSKYYDEGQLIPLPTAQKSNLTEIEVMDSARGMEVAHGHFTNRSVIVWVHQCVDIDEENDEIAIKNKLIAIANENLLEGALQKSRISYIPFNEKPYFDDFSAWYGSNKAIQKKLKTKALDNLVIEFNGGNFQANDRSQGRINSRIQMMKINNHKKCVWLTAGNEKIEMTYDDMVGLANKIISFLEQLLIGG